MKNKLLPEVDKGCEDKDFCVLVVETTVTLVKCAAMGRCQDGGYYMRVLDLVEEAQPWLRGGRPCLSSLPQEVEVTIVVVGGGCLNHCC
ncbi:hypothetical protein K1719_044211 [Acacia pycnantha]|nr:hypothetical protein K1719_044211 [Acacia pycnantha]